MAGINLTIPKYNLTASAWKWYCMNYVDIKVYDDDTYVINGVCYSSYESVLNRIEDMAAADYEAILSQEQSPFDSNETQLLDAIDKFLETGTVGDLLKVVAYAVASQEGIE